MEALSEEQLSDIAYQISKFQVCKSYESFLVRDEDYNECHTLMSTT